MRDFTAKQVEQMTGATIPQQCLYGQRGLLRCRIVKGQKVGKSRRYDVVGLFSVRCVHTLRNGNNRPNMAVVDYDSIKPIAAFINARTEDELRDAAERGLVLMAGCGLGVRFAAPEESVLNRTGRTLHIVGFDMAESWRRMWDRIELLDSQTEAQTLTN